MAHRIRQLMLIMIGLGFIVSLVACASATADVAPPTATPAAQPPEPVAEQQEDVAPPPTPGPEREDPGEVVSGFYQWYLGYEGNVLVDGAYRDHPVVSLDFAEAVQDRLASFDQGAYDPFLCARDRPDAIDAGMITISGDTAEVAVSTSFPGHAFTVVLVAEGQSWQITDVVCDMDGDASPVSDDVVPEAVDDQTAAGGPREIVPDWPVLVDDTWHFQVQYPAGWTIEDVDLDDPNKPPAGKMDRLVLFWPEGWEEDFVVLQMDVYNLDDEAFAMEFIPATSEEEIVRDDGVVYTKYLHEFGEFTMVQYGFRSPSSPDVRVIFTECVSGWPDRAAGHEDIVAVYEPMIQSFGFTE
ncbi:MAG: DUF3828 domain-containing protein [Anaerolineae bacterium]|nr:DUF3828 domain-containing protein [Anaerolineae bacterium]